jgi:hypothetical protein
MRRCCNSKEKHTISILLDLPFIWHDIKPKDRLFIVGGDTSYDDEPKPLTSEDILAIRKSAGLSQVKFAAALGVSVKKVSAWEHGKAVPDEAEIEKIRKMK